MPPEEIYTPRGANVGLEAGYLRIVKSKTPAVKRRIELTPEAQRILAARVAASGDGYLFPSKAIRAGRFLR